MNKKEKKRDYATLLLLLLLLYIGGTVIYYSKYPYNEVKHAQQVPADKPVTEEKQPMLVLDTTDTRLSDTVAVTRETAMKPDTNRMAATTQPATVAKPAEAPTPEPDASPTVSASAEEHINSLRSNKELIDISPDGDVVCLYDPVRKNLHFYPTKGEWGNVYLVYPSPDYKSLLRRNLIYPDYNGIIYPVYKKGKATYNGKAGDAVAVKINATASRSKTYVIRAKSAPEYFVFGDYQNRERWYIYENGKVRKFSPPDNFDREITDNLK